MPTSAESRIRRRVRKYVDAHNAGDAKAAAAVYAPDASHTYASGVTDRGRDAIEAGIYPGNLCGGIGWRPVVAPDGTAYVPLGQRIGVSTDSGLTWQLIDAPDPGEQDWFQVRKLAVASDGTLYAIGAAGGPMVHLARSSDGGATWQGPWRVAPPDVTYSMGLFSAVAAGEDGRVAVALLGTADPMLNHNEAARDTRWDLYLVVSPDTDRADPVFASVRATDDPVQVGPVCLGRAGGCQGEADRNLLDFIDATAAPDGAFYVPYTDGCIDECATKAYPEPEDSRDSAVAWLEGWALASAP